MNFLAPLALLLGLLAGPIILLYMLRLRRREVQVSSTLLWQMLMLDREANAPWQKLRRNLLLFLQLLILAALVLALARPYIEVPTVTAGRTALLVDASASMNATDVQPNRFEVARQRALEIVDSLSATDSLAVIRVAEGPAMLESYTNDREALRAAINAMQPSKSIPDWDAALTLAAAGAQGAEQFTMVLISDGGLPADLNLSAYGEARFIPVGASDQNLGITALATAHDPVTGPQIYARLTNYGAQPAETILSINLDGALHNAQRYSVPANSYIDVVVQNLPPIFRRVEAVLTRPAGSTVPDYLALDDRAYATYNPASAGRAVLMTRGNRFLEQGFASLPDWLVYRGDPARGLPSDVYDLYIFDGWLPAALPEGNLLIVNPPRQTPPGFDLFLPGELSPLTRIQGVRPDDPRTRYLRFDEVNIQQFRVLLNINWADPLVVAEGGPLIYAGERGGRRIAILAFNLFDSDLPLKIAWPILLANLTEWYKSPRAIKVQGSLEPGSAVAIEPLSDATLVRVTRPDGAVTTLNVENSDQSALIYADTPLTGIYTVDVYRGEQIAQQELFAVNLFDPLEGRIGVRAPTLGQGQIAASGQQEVGQREYWPWIALLALGILALEWYAYFRRLQAPRLNLGALRRFGRRT